MSESSARLSAVEFSERYDQESDIYYVSFQTGEPSCVVEHDDILLVEIGIFSRMATGFRILNYTKHKSAAQRLKTGLKQDVKNAIQRINATAKSKAKSETLKRENRISQFLEKVS